MKLFTFLFAPIITEIGFGQETPSTMLESQFERWHLGVGFSPDYCFRTLRASDGNLTSEQVLELRNSIETNKFGYSTGIDMNFNFRRKIGIGMGVQYSNKGYGAKLSDLVYGTLIDPRQGFVQSNTQAAPTAVQIIYNFNYMDIPVKAVFTFGDRKIRCVTSAGIAVNILIRASSKITKKFEDGSNDTNTSISNLDYNKLNVSPFVSAGIDWKLSNMSSFRIEPTFRYGVMRLFDGSVSDYLWNAGLNFSYYFGLNCNGK